MDSISIVRTIAVIMAAAWLIKLFEEGGIRNEVVEIQPPRPPTRSPRCKRLSTA